MCAEMCVDETIRQQVVAALKKIEAEANIKILLAVESGSRAWGFPSPNSDYDVRFVFIRPYTAYLSIYEPKESLTFPITNELDLDGWDIRKVLRHIRKSNSVMFEWLQSPVVYKQAPHFAEELRQTALPYFSPYAGLYHYLGLVKNFYEYLQESDTIKIKRLFYILRSLLAAWWIIEKKSVPPMEFAPLLAVLPDKPGLTSAIQALLKEKATAEEGKLITVPSLLKDFIAQTKIACESFKDFFPSRDQDTSRLDQYFLKLLKDLIL